jgi:hypothetical protein
VAHGDKAAAERHFRIIKSAYDEILKGAPLLLVESSLLTAHWRLCM